MAKKKAAKAATGETLQSVCNAILDKHTGSEPLTGTELFEKVRAIRPDAKEGSVGQCLNKWKKAKGLIKTRGARNSVKKAKPGRNATRGPRSPLANHLRLVETHWALGKALKLTEILDIPRNKLPDVLKVLLSDSDES